MHVLHLPRVSGRDRNALSVGAKKVRDCVGSMAALSFENRSPSKLRSGWLSR